jgi:hypothetical protein
MVLKEGWSVIRGSVLYKTISRGCEKRGLFENVGVVLQRFSCMYMYITTTMCFIIQPHKNVNYTKIENYMCYQIITVLLSLPPRWPP